jgi:hypothetical protein
MYSFRFTGLFCLFVSTAFAHSGQMLDKMQSIVVRV